MLQELVPIPSAELEVPYQASFVNVDSWASLILMMTMAFALGIFCVLALMPCGCRNWVKKCFSRVVCVLTCGCVSRTRAGKVKIDVEDEADPTSFRYRTVHTQGPCTYTGGRFKFCPQFFDQPWYGVCQGDSARTPACWGFSIAHEHNTPQYWPDDEPNYCI
jgi:hypothetical protein